MDTQRYGWSFPVGRVFGIQIRVHVLLLVFTAVELLEGGSAGGLALKLTAAWLSVLWLSVLLHELGHCFVARRMGGSAEYILLWPLGGLAAVDYPRNWRAAFWTCLGGPAVNFALAAITVAAILLRPEPDLNPMGSMLVVRDGQLSVDWVRAFYNVNFALILLNILPIFPLDGGGMARAFLWRKWGYGQATLMAVKVGKVFAVLLAVYGLWWQSLLIVCLAAFCFFAAEQERVALEMGAGEEGFMGYDFSNGYTSLEASSPRPARRTSLRKRISRWFTSRRAERQARREKDEEDEMKARVDSLLDKIAREGIAALTEKEREFLNDASKHYRM